MTTSMGALETTDDLRRGWRALLLPSEPVEADFQEVEARGLVKVFGATRALSGVELRLRAGCVTAIGGPNGSGKSTLLSILSLVTRPTRGELRFGGRDAVKERSSLRGTLGVVAHSAMLYPDLSGEENLALFAELYGAPASAVADARERFELKHFWQRPTRTYSRGQLQRVSLARALIHAPRLLLLDEPSNGLDQRSTERLVEAVRAERERGAIIALVTHDAALADTLADERVQLIRGRTQSADSKADTKAKASP